MNQADPPSPSLAARIGLFVGPLAALVLWAGPNLSDWLPGVFPQRWSAALTLDPDQPALNAMAAVAALMAIWWLTEAIPMAATALVPLALYPLLGVMSGKEVAPHYGNHLVFLFLGGFLVALAIEESGLHRRIALHIVAAMGDNPRLIVAGFMLATAALSMWISNTATTLMMLPIGASILVQADRAQTDAKHRQRFGVALMLGIAYAASIGGVGTLIGTPPNLAFKAIYEAAMPDEPKIEFFRWMVLAVPFSASFLVVAWLLLVRVIYPLPAQPLLGGGNVVRDELQKLGRLSKAEVRMAVIFFITALLWVTREPMQGYGWGPLLLGADSKLVNDGTSAVLMAIVCFMVPSGSASGEALLTWKATTRLPWGILLLFGGGLALAAGMHETELDGYLGERLAAGIAPLPNVGKAALIACGMTWLTELTSNLASIEMLTPVLAEASLDLKTPPLVLMIPATLSASCAFMLPVATPPNAIVYGSGRVRMRDMIRAGVVLNFVGIVLVVATVWLLGRLAFGDAAAL
ncbi:MAG: DASS family sodium-coupled anion symporter [Pirellulaceae bacterium]